MTFNGTSTRQNTEPTTTQLDIRPFQIAIAEAAIEDLHRRLAGTRFPAETPGDDWTHGTPVSYLRDMVDYWHHGFDWPAQQARMNQFPHFLTEIDGQTIHFLHIRSPHQHATPLLLTHTYPGSFADFLDMIGPLTDPETHGGHPDQAFHLVIPSLPGMGFSTPLTDGGWTMGRVARTFDTLMRALGYTSYGAHGSDGGAIVSRELAILNPDGFLGAHVLQLFSFPSGDPTEFDTMTPADYTALEFAGWFNTVNGYAHMNASRPQTIAARVNTGPIGITVFADDFKSIRPFAERDNTNIVSWTEQPRGGHFASMEVPDVLTAEIRAFYATDHHTDAS
jgi:pimeloyl-ACP methyl ester carboxylesterase